jgi:hypothetical protein
VFRRHVPRTNPGASSKTTTTKEEGRQHRSSLRRDGSTRDLTESTAHNDLGSSLSQLELRRNQSYETEEAPTTLASTVQPTASGSGTFDRGGRHVENVVAAMHLPPPESVSLARSGCSCSELSDDDDDDDDDASAARRRGDTTKRPLPDAATASLGPNVPASQRPPAAGDHAAAAFVPPEFVYLTPDNCWPLEL